MRLFRERVQVDKYYGQRWISEVHQYLRNRWKKGTHKRVKRRNSQRIKRGSRRECYDRYQGREVSKRKICQQSQKHRHIQLNKYRKLFPGFYDVIIDVLGEDTFS